MAVKGQRGAIRNKTIWAHTDMKTIDILIIAAIATAICSCGERHDVTGPVKPAPEGTVRLDVVGGASTKTALTPDGKVFWGTGEKLAVLEKAGGTTRVYESDEGVSADGGATMRFGVTLDALGEDSFTYDAVYPSAAMISSGAVSSSSVAVSLPAKQTPASSSFDPSADILLAKTQTTASQPSELSVRFKRPVSIGSLLMQGIPTGEQLYGLTLSFNKGGSPVSVAGQTTFDLPKDGHTFSYGSDSTLEFDCMNVKDNGWKTGVEDYDYHDLFEGALVEGQTYTPTASGVGVPGRIYFTCWPFELGSGDSFTITALTGSKLYSRTVTIPSGRTFIFTEGDVSLFTVDMSSATVTALPEMITGATFGVAASSTKTDALPVSSYDAATRTWTVLHVSDFSLLSDSYTLSEHVTMQSSTSGDTRTIVCNRAGVEATYRVVLADYVTPDDSFRPSGSWTLRWNDEFEGDDWDRVTYVRSEPSGSYASVHHDRTREDLVTMSDGAVHIWAKSGTNGEAQTTSTRNGNTVNCPVIDGYVTGGIRQNYWDIWRTESQDEHTYIRSSEAGSAWRLDARVKMGKANGFWPAVWLIPYRMTRNPHGGEIDLMECATYVDKVYQTVHCTWTASDAYTSSLKSQYPQYAFQSSFDMTSWHIFSVVVTPLALKYYIDGTEILTWTNREDEMGATGEYEYQNRRATVEGMEPASSQRTYQYPYFVTDYRLLLTAQLGLNGSLSSNDDETWSWMDSYTGGVPDHPLNGTGIPVSMDIDFIRYYTQD